MSLETSWDRLGCFWWRLGGIWRSLWDVLGVLGGVLGAHLDVLEVPWKAMWARICQDVDRNPRDVKTLKKIGKNKVFCMSGLVWNPLGRVLGILAGALEVSWRPLGCSLWFLGSFRGTKTGQDGPRWSQGVQGWIQIGRASAASESSGAIGMNPDV